MAVASVTCPHCQQSVEMQASAENFSRTCPACGEVVIKSPAREPLPNRFEGLPEDAFERMRSDPALQKMRRKFFGGVAVVVGLVIAAVVVHLRDDGRSQKPVQVVHPSFPASEVPTRRVERAQPTAATVSLEERLERLKSGQMTPVVKRDEKFAAPVFDLKENLEGVKKPEQPGHTVFEVSDTPTIFSPEP